MPRHSGRRCIDREDRSHPIISIECIDLRLLPEPPDPWLCFSRVIAFWQHHLPLQRTLASIHSGRKTQKEPNPSQGRIGLRGTTLIHRSGINRTSASLPPSTYRDLSRPPAKGSRCNGRPRSCLGANTGPHFSNSTPGRPSVVGITESFQPMALLSEPSSHRPNGFADTEPPTPPVRRLFTDSATPQYRVDSGFVNQFACRGSG